MNFFIVLLYVLLGIILLGLCRWITEGNVINLFKRPVSLCLLQLFVVHSFLPVFQYLMNLYRYGTYSDMSHIISIIVTLVFVFFMVLTYMLSGNAKEKIEPLVFPMNYQGKMFLLICVALPAILLSVSHASKIGSFGYDEYMQDRIGFSDREGGMDLLLGRWVYMSFIVAFAAYQSSEKKDKIMLFWAIFLGVFTFAFYSYTSARHAIFISVMVVIGIYFVLNQKKYLSLTRVLFSKASLIVLAMGIGIVAVGNIRAEKIGGYSENRFEQVFLTLNNGFGNHELVVWLVSNDFNYMYGQTYMAGFVNPFPRAFWPNKPFGAGASLKNMIMPGSYQWGAKGISSLTTGWVTEAYMNGGLIGVIIIGSLTGLLLKFIANMLFNCHGPWAISIYCYTAFMYSFSMTYGEFNGIYTRWLTDVFPLFLGWLFYEYREYKELYNNQLISY